MKVRNFAARWMFVVVALALFTLASSCTQAAYDGSALPTTPSIERGRYLVDVMGCHNCHTPWNGRDRGPAGLLADKLLSGRDVFHDRWATTSARNITPDRDTGIGGWTDSDIRKLLQTGIRPDGVPVGNRMPSGYYKILTQVDLDSVVLYLRSLPAVRNTMPGSEYKAYVPPEVVPGTDHPLSVADLADPIQRGRYVGTLARCMQCHTPLDQDEKVRNFGQRYGAGGAKAFTPEQGAVISTNITSSKSAGLGGWTDAEIKRAITQGISRDGHKLKAPMPYGFYARMSAADLDALIRWLRTIPAID